MIFSVFVCFVVNSNRGVQAYFTSRGCDGLAYSGPAARDSALQNCGIMRVWLSGNGPSVAISTTRRDILEAILRRGEM